MRFAWLLALMLSAPALAQAPLDRVQRADGAHVVPDRFLRRWDPVTILFDQDEGPASGGAEDAPQRLVTMAPSTPGAWQWLGARTLQFRPSEPWRPLQRVTLTVAGNATTLVPLLPSPVATGPADAPAGTPELDTVALTFTEPVEEAALTRLLSIELRPSPGLSAVGAEALSPADYTLRPVDRAKPGDRQTYLVVLRRPVPDGRVAVLRLRLSDAAGLDDPSFEMRVRSAAPFGLMDTYCGDGFDHETKDGAVRCNPSGDAASPRVAILQFTGEPVALDIVRARAALRITPPVEDLAVTVNKAELRIGGRFAADTVYDIAIAPGALADQRGRTLGAPVNARISFAAPAPALVWDAAQGLVERLGPQMVPLRGRGYDRADLRIHAIDPLGRDFWPWPRTGLVTTDDTAPPLPGLEPARWVEAGPIDGDAMAARIAALGSPAVSTLVTLPIRRGGTDAKFGLDVAPHLQAIAGAQQPGTYLLGIRSTDGSARRWARVQVTDLSLSTVEEADRVRFVVTSLSTAQPVPGAEVRVEGVRDGAFVTLARGTTDADGAWMLPAPLTRGRDRAAAQPRRFVVTKATDTLVLEPGRGPQVYAGERWQTASAPWLGWTAQDTKDRQESARLQCHVFTERPIYRPEEPILVAGMIRRYRAGTLDYATGAGEVVITAPDDQEWRLPVTLDDVGGFHVRFGDKTEPTGDYAIKYQSKDGEACGPITVKKEAYRLPTFEVVLNGPEKAALDAPFRTDLLARWFAGGLLSDRPITWRVTQFPYAWAPPGRDGFNFSSDSRFSNDSVFRSTPVLNREAKTDAGGSAQLTLDPTIEPTAQPRLYLVEATVTGDDDIQVRSTQHITALPPFVLGVKVPRYLPQAGAIEPEVLALDGEGKPVSGLPMTIRLVARRWNAVLQASDFAQGSAKYQTQVLDETVEERRITSAADAQAVRFEVSEAGVYVVELEAEDRVGRKQVVRVDLFMAGDTPVTWSRPPAQTVTVTPDKDAYAPGESATLLIQSPFQTARALAITEEPEGRFRYDWLDITGGVGRYAMPVRKQQVPRVPVHFLVMRGRLPGPQPANAPFDQGKPTTVAATAWVKVTPVENRVVATFEAPEVARPGQEIELVLHLADAAGRPLAGEATVWLVDQAVLARAREQPLDPLPAFLVDRPIRMAARDTRNMAFGILPLNETPGGDENGDFGIENISVRKNFSPVPFYAPRVRVGADGTARIKVMLPDTLTVFMLRAKAISGPDRFGYAAGQLRVRQPIVAQAALPRFVRPGDSFQAAMVGRVVEGPGGAGRSAISVDNLLVQGPAEQAVSWPDQRPARIEYTVSVPEPPAGTETARVRFLLQRTADRASDAVQIDLPIRPDRVALHRRAIAAVGASGVLDIPAVTEGVRAPSLQRTVTLASDPAVLRVLGGLSLLLPTPCGCVEQRISLAASELALMPLASLMNAAGLQARLTADVAAAVASIKQSTDDDGLVAFWPRGKGSVWLTASAYRFLAAADRAAQPVDKPAMERMAKVLTAALRSDYPRLLSGEELRERVAAMVALADGGALPADYAGELARRAQTLPTESVAQVLTVLTRLPNADRRLLSDVLDVLWSRVNVLSRDGAPAYAGLQDRGGSPFILPSETRTLANVLRAVVAATPQEPRIGLLRTGLVGLATGEGWGNTNATAAAVQALGASLQGPIPGAPASITLDGRPVSGPLDAGHPLLTARSNRPGAGRIQARPGTLALIAADFVPSEPGAAARATQNGFVVTRTLYKVGAGPMARIDAVDGSIPLSVGDVLEEVDEVATPEDRVHVLLRLPLPAGLEPLNPNLATAPAEAAPSAGPTLPTAYSAFNDDEVRHAWLQMPAGTVTVRHRLRVTVPGQFTQPPATAEMLYRPGVDGASAGQRVVITR